MVCEGESFRRAHFNDMMIQAFIWAINHTCVRLVSLLVHSKSSYICTNPRKRALSTSHETKRADLFDESNESLWHGMPLQECRACHLGRLFSITLMRGTLQIWRGNATLFMRISDFFLKNFAKKLKNALLCCRCDVLRLSRPLGQPDRTCCTYVSPPNGPAWRLQHCK